MSNDTPIGMSKNELEQELKLIRQCLGSIEEALAEELTDDDKQALVEAMKEHREGKTVPFTYQKARRNIYML